VERFTMMTIEGCPDCGRGMHAECELEECPCSVCSPPPPPVAKKEVKEIVDSLNYDETNYKEIKETKGDRPRSFKDSSSTGRKRAAMLYPFVCDACGHTREQHSRSDVCEIAECDCGVFKRKPCEWRNFKNNGGGRYPTIGCSDGLQSDRHHGPIKDTLRNELGNVHRICSQCHQRYHYLNDPWYDEKHDPEPATENDIGMNDLNWISGKMKKDYQLGRQKIESYD
jgi:hypothetical protein